MIEYTQELAALVAEIRRNTRCTFVAAYRQAIAILPELRQFAAGWDMANETAQEAHNAHRNPDLHRTRQS